MPSKPNSGAVLLAVTENRQYIASSMAMRENTDDVTSTAASTIGMSASREATATIPVASSDAKYQSVDDHDDQGPPNLDSIGQHADEGESDAPLSSQELIGKSVTSSRKKKMGKTATTKSMKVRSDISIASDNSQGGMSRPSSHLSSWNVANPDDMKRKYIALKAQLAEKEMRVQKLEKELKDSPKRYRMLGRRHGSDADVKPEVIVDPAVVLAQVRRRRAIILSIIVAGMTSLPVVGTMLFADAMKP